MKRHPRLAQILLVCGLLLAFAAVSWSRIAGTEMSWQGWLAFALGCTLSLALAVVLMGLLFYSSRSGADEEASDQSVFDRRAARRPGAAPGARTGDGRPGAKR
ncbi:hypothetical protein [Tistlia consotensis]|nr:hypothetical protein [Tistlia consotensis]